MTTSNEIIANILLVAALTVVLCFLVSLIRMEIQDHKRYKQRYDEQGRPNRPGGWGIQ